MGPGIRLLLLLTLAALLPSGAHATVVGVFQFVAGDVRLLVSAGGEKPARKGSPLSEGDIVITASAATAQIKMADGATVVVQPLTHLSVVEFRYAGVEDGSERVRYRLERGGIRSITGAIGRSHKDTYLIETPVAHMGVRGTDHESYFLPENAGRDGVPGAYSKVNVGQTYLRTAQGEVVVGPNEVGFVASAASRPTLLPAIPEFFNRAVKPATTSSVPAPGTADGNADRKRAAAEALPEETAQKARVLQAVHGKNGLALGTLKAEASDGLPANFPASGGAAGYVLSTGVNQVRTGMLQTIVPGAATLANTGNDAAFGVNWGSWQGGFATVAGTATQGTTHFINSTQLTSAAQLAALPGSVVSASYSMVGGPAPTNQTGVQGTLSTLNVGVNFSTQQITNYTVGGAVAGATWTGSGSGSIAQFSGSSGIVLNGSCSGCTGGPGSTTANGTAHGAFVGGSAERLITAFGLRAANQAFSGVGLLTR